MNTIVELKMKNKCHLNKAQRFFLRITGRYRMGTVEPIWKQFELLEDNHVIGFVRGFVKKYKNSPIRKKEIFEYLEGLVK